MDSTEPAGDPNASASTQAPDPTPTWTYPSRMCRICREDVVPTVTLFPPGLPAAFQHPVVEYKNEDEYGRLIKPCHCRGGMRYIHELCLLRSRTEGVRPGSLWKCHECGHQFNFQRLTVQRYLGSKVSSGILTVLVMMTMMFILGFIADPIINLYLDPYDTFVGNESYWQEVDVNASKDSLSQWAQHFMKGLVSMGLVGFLKTTLLNPFQWWNLRSAAFVSGRSSGTSTTGRDRAVNISWIAILIGVTSAFYFFYQWVQAIIGRALQKIGNNIVDTQLPADDEDLKPPPGFKTHIPEPFAGTEEKTEVPTNSWPQPSDGQGQAQSQNPSATQTADHESVGNAFEKGTSARGVNPASLSKQSIPSAESEKHLNTAARLTSEGRKPPSESYSSAIDDARNQSWSFSGL